MYKIIIKHKERNWGCLSLMDGIYWEEVINTNNPNTIKNLIDACNDIIVEYNIDTSAGHPTFEGDDIV